MPSLFKIIVLGFCSFTFYACGGGSADATSESSEFDRQASMSAEPGAVVTMQAQPESSEIAGDDYFWTQMTGPDVDVADTDQRTAHFVMPPLDEKTELTFIVDIEHAGGQTTSELITVSANGSGEMLDAPPPVITEQFVVFTADKDLDNRRDIYLAYLDGSDLFRLNGPLFPGTNIINFKISPDRRYVAYFASQNSILSELYVAKTDGSGNVKISLPYQSGGFINSDYKWSPDSTRVAYRMSTETGAPVELFVSTADGVIKDTVSGPIVTNGNVFNFIWSPNSLKIAYQADQNTDAVTELFVSDRDGSNNIRVSGPLVAGGGVQSDINWSPDSSLVTYRADQFSDNEFELFISAADGSSNSVISAPLVTDGDVFNYAWAPDGSRIAYRGDVLFDGVTELYSVKPDGMETTEVSAVPFDGDVSQFRWAPDSSRIAYRADQLIDGVSELFTSLPDGSDNVRVSGNLVTGGVVFSDFQWSPDSTLIAYRADQLTDNADELFVSTANGTSNNVVSGPLVAGGDVFQFSWSPDGAYLAYNADQLSDNRFELFTVTPDGVSNPKVSGFMVFDGDVSSFLWSEDGSRLVYRADQLVDEQYELFVAAPDGSVPNNNISGPLTTNGDVFNFATQ